jgi:2-polyprenyl-3-methyl-5-hydroxy-6-metoxy-1,4-benzoquinol methylase
LKPLWHPLSTLFLIDPPCLATPVLLRMMLGDRPVSLRYAGDRMWPAFTHGAELEVSRPLDGALRPGRVVVAAPDGIPDLLRIAARDGGTLRLVADADPVEPVDVPAAEVLAVVDGSPSDRAADRIRELRRRWLEVVEAWRGRAEADADPAESVRDKYDAQAKFYARQHGAAMEARLLERLRQHVPSGGRALVIGSGAGKESFALAREGHSVLGVDFAEAMVAEAREHAATAELDVEFRACDVRDLALEPRSLAAALFTYEVYSFVPGSAARVDVLKRIRRWLRPSAPVFVSARRIRSGWERLLVGLQFLAARGRPGFEPGDSHTRWIDERGRLRRSYVHVFTAGQLSREVRAAGFRAEPWEGAHALLRPDGDGVTATMQGR